MSDNVPADDVPADDPIATTTDAGVSESSPDEPSGAEAATGRGLAGGWKWLIPGLVAAIVLPIVVSFVAPQSRGEFSKINVTESGGDEGELSAEDSAKLEADALRMRVTKQRTLQLAAGCTIAILFGLFAGYASGRIPMGIAGAVVGGLVALAGAALSAGPIIDYESEAVGRLTDGDMMAMAIHSSQWLLVALAGFAAVAVAAGSFSAGLKALASLALAGVLGAVVYVIGGALLDPTGSTSTAAPMAGASRYLWASIPPLLSSFFLARASR